MNHTPSALARQQQNTPRFPGSVLGAAPDRIGTMPDDLAIYKDLATETVYVLAHRWRHGVTLRDLDSEPGDPDGLLVISEWDLWEAVQTGRWQRFA